MADRRLLALVLIAACGGGQKAAPAPTPIPVQPEETPVETPVVEAPAAVPQETPVVALKFPDEDFRNKRPEVGAARPLQSPTITRFKLKNGIEVFLVERHALPTVSMDLAIDNGTIDDPKGKEGTASLCMNLLDDGTDKLDKEAFEEALADMASQVNANVSADQMFLSMETLSKNLDATLDLWAATILTPGLRDTDHQRNVKNAVAGIMQSKSAPGPVGARVFGSVFYGESHPFGRIMTETSVTAITVDDCKTFLKRLAPGGAKLFVVGDITKAQIEEKVGGRLAKWKGATRKSVNVPAAKPRKGRIFFVDVPGAPQSSVYLVHPGPARKAKDYFATRIAMAVLGGGFSSRINMNIREDKGWAYGARGGINYTRTMGTFVASASVRTDATKGSIEEIYKEIAKMIDSDVTDAELLREKQGSILALPGQFSTGLSTLQSFHGLVYFGLPLDYYASFQKNVEAVTKEAVRAAAKKNLHPKDVQVLVVGDAKTVMPMLQQLLADKTIGEGDLVVLDADGKVVTP